MSPLQSQGPDIVRAGSLSRLTGRIESIWLLMLLVTPVRSPRGSTWDPARGTKHRGKEDSFKFTVFIPET